MAADPSAAGYTAQHSLGNDVTFRWARDDEGVFGMVLYHPSLLQDGRVCSAWLLFRETPAIPKIAAAHTMIAGGPGDEGAIEIAQSLFCARCGHYGKIRAGAWTYA